MFDTWEKERKRQDAEADERNSYNSLNAKLKQLLSEQKDNCQKSLVMAIGDVTKELIEIANEYDLDLSEINPSFPRK